MNVETVQIGETPAPVAVSGDGKIICHIDGARVHVIQTYLKQAHPTWTIAAYKEKYPEAPLFSKLASDRRAQINAEKNGKAAPETSIADKTEVNMVPLAELFGLPAKAGENARGNPLMVRLCGDVDDEISSFIPDIDTNFVFDIDLLKSVLIGFEINKPIYFWGYHGTGKTSIGEQVCARMKRPWLRVQHTGNTEEAHIIGQYVVKNGATEYQLGPLPYAMLHGLVYCADEYDAALPSVCTVYQPVLEGKPLIIKDAPPELRIIRPHPNFRIFATGNTNGSGDETGLYQGTQIQNAANYSRFGITEEVDYMNPKMEIAVLVGQAQITKDDAGRLVEFANDVRKAFKAARIGSTISPRELINAAQIAIVRGSQWRMGLRNAFMARLSRTDREVVEQFAQRVWG